MYKRRHNVDFKDYGWNFQRLNKNSCVEFYIKNDMRMDYYYTTGGIKLMVDDKTKFVKNLSTKELISILENTDNIKIIVQKGIQ